METGTCMREDASCQTDPVPVERMVEQVASCMIETGCQTDDSKTQYRALANGRRTSATASDRRSRRYSSKHNPDLKDFFCVDCKRYICLYCNVNDHVEHTTVAAEFQEQAQQSSITTLTTHAREVDDRMTSFVEFLDEHAEASGQTVHESLEETTKYFDAKIKEVIEAKESHLRFYQQRERTIREQLQYRKNEIKSKLLVIQSVAESMQKAQGVRLEGAELSAHEICSSQFKGMLDSCDFGDTEKRKVEKDTAVSKFRPERESLESSSNYTWSHMHEVPLPVGVKALVALQDGRIAVGLRKDGALIITSNGQQQKTNLQGVKIQDVAVMTESRIVILDKKNNLTLHMLVGSRLEKISVKPFKTLEKSKAGEGSVTVDYDDHIYVGYIKASLIHEFTAEGGRAIREISCKFGFPMQLSALKLTKRLVVKGGPNLVLVLDVLDETGQAKKSVTKGHDLVAYPAVCLDDSIIIAWVNNKEGLVTIDQYTRDLVHVKTLIAEHALPKQESNYKLPDQLQQFLSGEIAFCSSNRLYIFGNS